MKWNTPAAMKKKENRTRPNHLTTFFRRDTRFPTFPLHHTICISLSERQKKGLPVIQAIGNPFLLLHKGGSLRNRSHACVPGATTPLPRTPFSQGQSSNLYWSHVPSPTYDSGQDLGTRMTGSSPRLKWHSPAPRTDCRSSSPVLLHHAPDYV